MSEPYAQMLTPAFRARLERLQLAVRRSLPSTMRGDRRSLLRKGASLEFADFRPYIEGDDVRFLDWAAYARLDHLIMKLYHDEEDLQVHLLVDDSASMLPDKALFARQVAAGLGWIALRGGARVSAALLGEQIDRQPALRGVAAGERLLQFLSRPSGGGKQPLHLGCEKYANLARPWGLVLVVTDLLDPAGAAGVLNALQRRTTELSVLQVLSPQDLDPDFEGDLRLKDAEEAPSVDISLSPARIEAYRRTVRGYVAQCAELCLRRGAAFIQASSARSLEDFFVLDLARARIVR
ncbi:MAG: DUF58 domain-containing protein [Planctomycetes bacterium]|nr:DUF58 domain-containing protein [Planctomycetota bacterium]